MINTIRIRGFKRFSDVTLRLPGHVVLAGPNNTGKTTVLQAIASWEMALRRWRELRDFSHGQGYIYAPIARQAFAAVPLRSFDHLWRERVSDRQIEIEVQHDAGWTVTMEFKSDSTEQIYVRPKADTCSMLLRELKPCVAFIPPMTGISVDEPLFQPPKIEQLLGAGRPGEVLRNLLVEVYDDGDSWSALQRSIEKLFGYRLRPPDTHGPHILVDYTMAAKTSAETTYDISSAGSGFLQVLMLLAFLNSRPGALLLLDEPDAHLHLILQDAIYHELRTVAARQGSQLCVATHSEVVINSVQPRELYVMLSEPRPVADNEERNRVISSLRVLTNADVMQAMEVRGILYVEGHTNISILRAWATRLGHPAEKLLTAEVMWKPMVLQTREYSSGSSASEHFESLKLVRDDLPGLVLVDGDEHPDIQSSEIAGTGLQRLRWRRYEIESYLVHPDSLQRFIESMFGAEAAISHAAAMREYMHREFPPGLISDPHGDHVFMKRTKARKDILPPLLSAAGVHNLPYTRFHEIAQIMHPEEIHPEVIEKLDAICLAFGPEP